MIILLKQRFARHTKPSQRKIKMKNKKASTLYNILFQIFIVGLVFAMFIFATAGRINSKEVKQQVIEKELALLIDSAAKGMSFSVNKINMNGNIEKVFVNNGRIFAYVNGLKNSKGYAYFTKYNVVVEEKQDKFIVRIE